MSNARSVVFVSYAPEDSAIAQRLTKGLLEAGISTWFDRQLEPGDVWGTQIEAEISRASTFVLLISPSYLASRYAMVEVGAALGRAHDQHAQIIPVILQDAELPKPLQRLQYVDGRGLQPEELSQRIRRAIEARQDQKSAVHEPGATARQISVFLSSSSYVVPERECFFRIVEEINHGVGRRENIVLDVFRWEALAPGMCGPEALILNALAPVDLFVAILWARMGPGKAGAIEELRAAIDLGRRTGRPKALIYVKDRQSNLESKGESHTQEIVALEHEIASRSLLSTFTSLEELEDRLRRDLSSFILTVLTKNP